MQAIVLAGGRGTRLAPYTTVFPKPLMPLDDMPIVEIVVRQLAHYGFTDITFAVGHLAELIQAFFGTGSRLGVNIRYSRENTPLGTAGPIALVEGLDESFLAMNGDVLTTLSFADLLDYHRSHGAIATVALFEKQVKIDLGIVETTDDGLVTGYVEKPTLKSWVSMGVYAFEPRVQRFIPKGQRLDLPDLVLKLVKAGETVVAYRFSGEWLDIGRPEDYQQATAIFRQRRAEFLPGDAAHRG